jgi:hypothetical protein
MEIRKLLPRLLIGIVVVWNLQAAFVFIFSPARFAGAYELSGVAGETAVRGFGILFLMWTLPYFAALADPVRHRLILVLCLLMQLTGFWGETWIYFTLPGGHPVLAESILRFIAFDGAGVVMLAIAWGISGNSSVR